jgi:hypothetical protein
LEAWVGQLTAGDALQIALALVAEHGDSEVEHVDAVVLEQSHGGLLLLFVERPGVKLS